MYNGLTDPDLQEYHKTLKYTGHFFLREIQESPFFKCETKGDIDYIRIYPLFYTDIITCDWDEVFIDSPYMMIVPKNFKGLISFIGEDEQVCVNRSYTIGKENGYYTIVIYNSDTCEILVNQEFTVEYENYPSIVYSTDDNGYFTFEALEDSFEVIL